MATFTYDAAEIVSRLAERAKRDFGLLSPPNNIELKLVHGEIVCVIDTEPKSPE